MTAPELAEEAGILPRYAREWLEQQAAAGFVTVDDPSAEPDAAPVRAARRTRGAAPRSREPVLDRGVLQVVRRGGRRDARARLGVPIRRPGPVGRVRPRHDRGAGRLQPVVARRVVRHRVPALDPRPPRTAVERREGRGRRVRCRLGRDLARPRVPERHRRRVRPRRVLDRDRPAQRRRGRGCRSGDVRGQGCGRPRAQGRVRLRDGDRGDPRPVAARRGARRDPRDAQARRHADRRRRADRGRVHGARERDRAALLRVQRPVLSALGDGRPLVRGDRHRHAPGRRSSATRRRPGSTRSRSCRSNTTSSASTGSTASLPR